MALLGPDLLLDPDTHDLAFSNGDLQMAVDVAQAVKINLLFVEGEWFLDRLKGVPYFSDVFVKAPNLDHVAAFFRAAIVETPGVGELLEFSFDFDTPSRLFSVEWKADTDDGEIGDIHTFAAPTP